MSEDTPEFYCQKDGLPLAGHPRAFLIAGEAAAEILAAEVRKCCKCGVELPFGLTFVLKVPEEWAAEHREWVKKGKEQ